ncbi:MAG: F0F1 ATP synthase subunit B [Acidobacteriota bacterium]
MDLVAINPGLIIWTIVTFTVLLILLRAVAWKPILGILDQREKVIRDSLEQARKAKEEAESLMARHREMLGKARQEVASLIEKGQRDAEQCRAEILERARREAEERARQFAEELERQKNAAIREIRAEAVDLVVAASSRIVRASLDDEKHRALISDYLDDLDSLPPE